MANPYPFNENELKDVRYYAPIPGAYGMPAVSVKKFNTPITPKENFYRIVKKEKPLWVPNVFQDFNFIQPMIMKDAYARAHGGLDWFGIDWIYEAIVGAPMVRPGTRRLSDINRWKEELLWPDLDAIDWQKDYEENYAKVLDPERPTMVVVVNGLFERTADLTSFEDTLCYMLEEPEILNEFYNKLADWHIQLIQKLKTHYDIDVVTWHDDFGTQISSFFSPNTFREILLPHYQKINKAAHEMGVIMNLHSCGCIGNQIENICNAGFDFWEGQRNCNDKIGIMKEFGERLGHISSFRLPPELSDEEFIEEVEKELYSIATQGRYIIAYDELDPNRNINGNELIYRLSRKMYND